MRTNGLREFEHTKEVGNHFEPNIWVKLAIFKYSCLYLNTKISYFKPIAADRQHNFKFVTVYRNGVDGSARVKWKHWTQSQKTLVLSFSVTTRVILGNLFNFSSSQFTHPQSESDNFYLIERWGGSREMLKCCESHKFYTNANYYWWKWEVVPELTRI